MDFLLTETYAEGTYTFVKGLVESTSITVTHNSADGKVRVYYKNASARAYNCGLLGKSFDSIEAAKDSYKKPAIKAAIEALRFEVFGLESQPITKDDETEEKEPETANTYTKFCPNVYAAKCKGEHSKGEEIIVETKYGKENECIVHNFLGKTRDGFNLYSITRADGFNTQEHARRKAEKLNGYAQNASGKSQAAWEASNEGADFLALAEPIKIGHHSEKRHRALIERNHNRMQKSVDLSKKAETYEARAEYWEARTEKIDLSMPESIEYFAFRLGKATAYHAGLKDGSIERSHSFSLTYANKEKKEMAKKLETAKRLWA